MLTVEFGTSTMLTVDTRLVFKVLSRKTKHPKAFIKIKYIPNVFGVKYQMG